MGVFRGRHEFDFSPIHKPDGTKRHLTIITGQNGVGKSTVFQALSLAFHGPMAISNKISRQAYNEFLWGRLHRYNGTGIVINEKEGGLKLGFQYIQSGELLRIQVERVWRSSSRTAQESIKAFCDGIPPQIDSADYQAWINELIPPGLSPICFFDAEQIDALASPEQQRNLLGHTLRGLLGLDLVEQLQADLERYTLLKSGGSKGLDRLRKDMQKCQTALRKCDIKLERLRASSDVLAEKEKQIELELAEQERQLAAKGGAYAARRPILEERLKAVINEMDTISDELRVQSAELLPFALAPELCQSLSNRLIRETELRQQQVSRKLWQERISDYRNILKGQDLWAGLRISSEDRKMLADRLMKKFRAMDSKTDGERAIVHNLADSEKEMLQGWITQALHTIPRHVQSLAEKLRTLQNEQRQIESDLQRAPDEEELMPFHSEISRLREASVAARRNSDELKKDFGSAQSQYDELARQLHRAKEKLSKAQGFKHQLVLAERSKAALCAYQDSLTRERLAELEKALVESFNSLCRKEHLLERVKINSDDFTVHLYGEARSELNLSDFSAGERELYSLALIRSLREVSGRRLPVIIDTPLARLDEAHRQRFIRDYVPTVSDQVVLITTDSELDEQLLAEAEPYLARVYRLSYDQERKESFVTMSEALPALTSAATFLEASIGENHVS
jgi:DNA sulfur modification protein DndD